MDFKVLKLAVAKQFDRMQKHDLFTVALNRDTVYEAYLSSFPAGTNELYRERTVHDCSCCKNFIKNIGNVVAVIDGKIESIWDVLTPSEPDYQIVVNTMSALIKNSTIENTFLHFENTAGSKPNFEQLFDSVKTYDHFFVNILSKFVCNASDIASKLAIPRVAHDTLYRALTTISADSMDTVLDLIAQRSLYRGDDHKYAVTELNKMKIQFDKLTTEFEKQTLVWSKSKTVPGSVSGMCNTSIGTFLVDLSKGKDLEHALRAYEAMVAPQNYKRPTAPITKAMIELAKTKLNELGLTSALERRYATVHDLSINNIMFANRVTSKVINGDVFDVLASSTGTKTKTLDKIEEVSIERFLGEILPRAESVEVMLENRLSSNLLSLIAPVDPTAGELFKWDNKFSWSYNGEMADSIKERVKAAGGSVTGDLCCRLAWDYSDDLDFHMHEPNKHHISFSNRRSVSSNGGQLDVDANGGDGQRPNPVENIFYANKSKMSEGNYRLEVNNYNRRSDGVGFEVEIEFGGEIHHIVYDKVLRSGNTLVVATINYSKANGFTIVSSLPSMQNVKNVWGLPTQTFHKVNTMMMSPNYWDDHGVGNKHYFFMLDGCVNDGSARGFFNEFLKDDLTEHRKVLEMVGAKMKVPESDQQLSGLGFSSTQKNTLVCRVKGNLTRTIKIAF